MKIGSVDLTQEVLVIAEIGNNHEGDLHRAEALIAAAAQAGAQAVKFQTIIPEGLVHNADPGRIAQLRRITLKEESFVHLASVAHRCGVMFLSTPFYLEAVDLLAPLVPAFKIASGDNDWIALLERVASTGKPMLLSTGMSDLDRVTQSVRVVEETWSRAGIADAGLALLHCVSSYPTSPAEANLAAIRTLASLGRVVGYSDHTIGVAAAPLAVAAGARVVEKHFTLDKAFSDFRDHALSADPTDLRELVARIRQVNEFMGSGKKRRQMCEAPVAAASRRSAYAARDLRLGTILTADDVVWLRPSGGVPASNPAAVIGRRLRTGLAKGQRFEPDHLI